MVDQRTTLTRSQIATLLCQGDLGLKPYYDRRLKTWTDEEVLNVVGESRPGHSAEYAIDDACLAIVLGQVIGAGQSLDDAKELTSFLRAAQNSRILHEIVESGIRSRSDSYFPHLVLWRVFIGIDDNGEPEWIYRGGVYADVWDDYLRSRSGDERFPRFVAPLTYVLDLQTLFFAVTELLGLLDKEPENPIEPDAAFEWIDKDRDE